MLGMSHTTTGPGLPKAFGEAIEDLLPIVRRLADGEYAVSLGGSIGKGTSDERSDVDLRLFCREPAKKAQYDASMATLSRRIEYWRTVGVEVDDCWVRRIDDVEEGLRKWVSGVATPEPVVWSLWGYHLPTDIDNQYVIEDPGESLRDGRQC
jgi:nucleotidyltransferase-like protein